MSKAMMKTVFLHIGRGKTGTTALQKYLADSRALLLDAGVQYLQAGDRGGGHQHFAKSFITAPPGFMTPAQDPQTIRAATAAEIVASTAPALLISSENFPLADIDALRDWFAALPTDLRIKVIFFARSQDELVESEYNQMVKLKRETRSTTDYAATIDGADYFAECEGWAARFGRENILARVYDGAAQDTLAQFLSCLPGGLVPDPALPKATSTAYANRSLGARALLMAQQLNRVEIRDRDALYRRLFAAFDGHDMPAVLFSADQARALRARFAHSNAQFFATYLGTVQNDLGGRRYDDATRDRLYNAVQALNIAP